MVFMMLAALKVMKPLSISAEKVCLSCNVEPKMSHHNVFPSEHMKKCGYRAWNNSAW